MVCRIMQPLVSAGPCLDICRVIAMRPRITSTAALRVSFTPPHHHAHLTSPAATNDHGLRRCLAMPSTCPRASWSSARRARPLLTAALRTCCVTSRRMARPRLPQALRRWSPWSSRCGKSVGALCGCVWEVQDCAPTVAATVCVALVHPHRLAAYHYVFV